MTPILVKNLIIIVSLILMTMCFLFRPFSETKWTDKSDASKGDVPYFDNENLPQQQPITLSIKQMPYNPISIINRVSWPNEHEIANVDFNAIKSKLKPSRGEFFKEIEIFSRDEAITYLNTNASFAFFPQKGAEDAEYYYFSLPHHTGDADDFSNGIAVKKATGDIIQWTEEMIKLK